MNREKRHLHNKELKEQVNAAVWYWNIKYYGRPIIRKAEVVEIDKQKATR